MHTAPPLQRRDAAWLLLMGAVSLSGAGVAHSHLGLRLQPQSWLLWVAFLCVGPWIEEWALRAHLLPELTRALRLRAWRRAHAQWAANAVVSGVFAALHHGMAGPQAWLWFLPSWVLGVVWFRYRRLLICTGLHIWFNASLALVTFGWPAAAQAQSPGTQATPHAPMSTPPAPMPPEQTVPLDAWPKANTLWQGVELDAKVLRIDGQWVLQVGRLVGHQLVVEGKASRLLDHAGPVNLPALRFEGPLLHVRWREWVRPDQDGSEQDQQWHEMSFDSQQTGWPLVTYRHEVSRQGQVSGVSASLVDASARWYRHAAGADHSSDTKDVRGLLQASPLVLLANMPPFRDFSIVPRLPKVHR